MTDFRIILLELAIFLTAGLAGCSRDQMLESGDLDYTNVLMVNAKISGHAQTRAYQESGRVVDGNFFLSFPNNANQYQLAVVDFDRESMVSPGVGIVTTSSGTELKWSEIGGSPVNLFLDNVPPSFDMENSSGPVVKFSPDNNPFVAGIFDSVDGSNDLLWGDKTVVRDTKSVSFDLHHNMSRVKVQIKVAHTNNSVGEIDLKNAVVRISDLYARTLSFDRITGNLALDSINARESVLIVDHDKDGYDWSSISTPEDNPDTTVYISPDIVLPPQVLLENENRPRLIITLEDGTEYSGILPHAMLIPSSADGSLSYPVTLAFLKEYILQLRTVITEEPPELSFMPVYVVNWVDKGEFTEEAHQSGIYTPSEFYKLIEYYEINNKYQLVRYGYVTTRDGSDTPIWRFNFWSSVELDYQQIYDKMNPGSVDSTENLPYDFEFSFNNYTVCVRNGDGAEDLKKVTASQLYDICTGRKNWSQIN